MSEIKNIGGFLAMDDQGNLINECSLAKVQEPWKAAVEEVRALYEKNMGPQVHSVYLRGSLPRGKAIEEISDLDTMAVLNDASEKPDLSWALQARKDLAKKYPFISAFDFDFIPLAATLKSPGHLSCRFIIKTLSTCILGEDLAPKLSPYRPSLILAMAFHGNIRQVVAQATDFFENSEDEAAKKQCCTWVMKRILRTGFTILLDQEKRYTRDLYPCYEVFSQHYPDQKAEMRQALELAINPSGDKTTVLPLLEGFGIWLVGEAEKKFFKKKR